MSKSFQSEMREMSESVPDFFDRYAKDVEAKMAFAKNFGAFDWQSER